jgi:hypothetical protein
LQQGAAVSKESGIRGGSALSCRSTNLPKFKCVRTRSVTVHESSAAASSQNLKETQNRQNFGQNRQIDSNMVEIHVKPFSVPIRNVLEVPPLKNQKKIIKSENTKKSF